MKKVLLLLVIAVLAFWAFKFFTRHTEPIQEQPNNEERVEEPATAGETLGDADSYQISSGSTVSYVADKEFFGKPTEKVRGTTSDVSGSVSLVDGLLSVSATVNPETLESGSGLRDDYVRDEFDTPVVITLSDFELEVDGGGSIVAMVPLSLSINDIEKEVDFEVTASVSGDGIRASGFASIDMTEFDVTPASLAGVYTVADVAEIEFVLMALR